MKKLVAILGFSLMVSALQAQFLSIETFVQESAIGMQKGYAIHYVNSNGWGLGPVFQSSHAFSTEINETNYPFLGVEAKIPLQHCNRLKFQFIPKIGFVNRDFLVFIPEVQTEYSLTKTIGLGMGAGIRVREAAISFRVIFQPFKNFKS